MNPYIVFSAVLGLGLRGIRNKIELTRPPISTKGLKDGSAASEVRHFFSKETLRGSVLTLILRTDQAREVAQDAAVGDRTIHGSQLARSRGPRRRFCRPLRCYEGMLFSSFEPHHLQSLTSSHSQLNEWNVFSQAVTDWELKRYLELA